MAFMRSIPNMVVSAPMDEIELRNLMYTAQLEKNNFPFSIRYPRGRGIYTDWEKPFVEIEIGKARQISEGSDIAVLSIGHPGITVASVINKLAKENIPVAQYDMRFVAPLDKGILHSVFKKFRYIITVEDGVLKGGFGSSVIEFMSDNGYNSEIRRLGVPDYFVEQGTQEELYRECGFDAEGIEIAIREIILKLKG
jgi:1-deoxy-D-xylulose-5-phosphate synthase